MLRRILPLALVALLAACSRDAGNPAPPRVEDGIALPEQTSALVVPVSTDLDTLAAGLNRETPRNLWSIDRHEDKCLKAKRVDIGIGRLKVLPDLGCRIVGTVTRGPIRLTGKGDRLFIAMPVRATLSAKDVGGMASKTANGAAMIRATARLGIAGNWEPTAKVDLDYDWTEPPGVDLLGKRITFTDKADEKLKGVIAKLERDLPRELAKLRLRQQLDGVWRQAFTTIELSKQNPPAWMLVAPRRLGFAGYRVDGRRLTMTLSAQALTQTFVGAEPDAPDPIPLPPPAKSRGPDGLRFFVPVLADYAQLEPVVQKALRKLAAKGIVLKRAGPVDAKFGDVTVYATTGGRLAIGVKAKVKARAASFASTSGEAWLTAIPFNEPGSQVLKARDVAFATRTDSKVVNLLVSLFSNPAVQASIAEGLTHDFGPDYQKVLGKAQKAIGARQEGDFRLTARIEKVVNGRIEATGAGLFLPVTAEGTARIEYRPQRGR